MSRWRPMTCSVLADLTVVLVQIGRPDQALQLADQAAARDPALGWSYNYGRGWAYLVLGRFGEAADALTQTNYGDAPLLLAIAYARLGRLADARVEVGKMMKINPAITVQGWRLGSSFRDPSHPRPLFPRPLCNRACPRRIALLLGRLYRTTACLDDVWALDYGTTNSGHQTVQGSCIVPL